MAKIIKENGYVLHRSAYWVTQDEWEGEEFKQEHGSFMELLHQRLCSGAIVGDQAELGIEYTLKNDLYEDDLQNADMGYSI